MAINICCILNNFTKAKLNNTTMLIIYPIFRYIDYYLG
ncbi:hypothetical protein AB162_550 [Candidatus Palibaumannia cicadellinicola]|uniref:Uncharacterized protein n=1 Tax=Candidatus Palibaumannia cicadellinicola TaxID=186490 RepID=A0A0K2BLR5_9GAMM|nr:hypothetical protein AB162_550 [Candidatus Baumannia cicadellinicola]